MSFLVFGIVVILFPSLFFFFKSKEKNKTLIDWNVMPKNKKKYKLQLEVLKKECEVWARVGKKNEKCAKMKILIWNKSQSEPKSSKYDLSLSLHLPLYLSNYSLDTHIYMYTDLPVSPCLFLVIHFVKKKKKCCRHNTLDTMHHIQTHIYIEHLQLHNTKRLFLSLTVFCVSMVIFVCTKNNKILCIEWKILSSSTQKARSRHELCFNDSSKCLFKK